MIRPPPRSTRTHTLFPDTTLCLSQQGGKLLIGGDVVSGPGNCVQPTIFEMPKDAQLMQDERFVPVLYVTKISSVDEGIEINNSVKQRSEEHTSDSSH